MPKKGACKAIFKAVLALCNSSLYCGRWIKEEVILDLVQQHGDLDGCAIDVTLLRSTFGRQPFTFVNHWDTPNDARIYRRHDYAKDVNSKNNKYCKEFYFYFTKESNSIPRNIVNWESKAITNLNQLTRRRSNRLSQCQGVEMDCLPVRKRLKRNTTETNYNHDNVQHPQVLHIDGTRDIHEHIPKSKQIQKQTKWDSPEALSLFVRGATGQKFGNKQDDMPPIENIDVKKHVQSQIQLLRKAYLTPQGWKNVVDDEDEDHLCTAYDIFILQTKCKYLAITLTHALSHYASTVNFLDICTHAIDKVNEFDFDGAEDEEVFFKVKSPRTVMAWLRSFRKNNHFPNPARNRQQRYQKGVPRIFHDNPDLYLSFMTYARSNLDKLSGEMMHEYLFNTALPEIAKKIEEKRRMGKKYSVKKFLEDNGIPTLTLRTVYKWLKQLGFTYSPSKKSYYVDSHEKAENVLYRSQFIDRYQGYERRCHRWIQIPLLRFENMVEKGMLEKNAGFKFQKDGATHVELHIDDHPVFQEECNHLQFGGYLSVRKGVGVKPLMIFGQDECIFKQYNRSNKSWSDPDGTRALLPKEDGQGVMISAFASREFGFGMQLTASQLDKVNKSRSRGVRKYYSDKNAAISKNGTAKKKVLTTSPFVQSFEYGNNNEGYWSYECMVLQLEDCIDCLQVLLPSYDYLFLFDHSNGHDRMQPEGLNAKRINKNFGGKQPRMRSSKLTDKRCFGPYHNDAFKLQLGDTQHMNFTNLDTGPFYFTKNEKEDRKIDGQTGRCRKRPILKDKLVEMLKEKNVLNPKGGLQQLQQQCAALDLPLSVQEPVIREGWLNKPKGAFQILFERGWIDPSNIRQYTEKGQKDEMGNLDEDTSINLLIQKQPDFMSELTLLQYHGKKLGVQVDRTPKCHPELAGEGIEYVWSLAKLYYRHYPLVMKRSKNSFRALVDKCISPTNKLDVITVRKCARRAREYMLLYKAYEQVLRQQKRQKSGVEKEVGTGTAGINFFKTFFNYDLIEKSIKTYKSHRNTRDFDVKFVQNLKLDAVKVEFVKKVVNEMKSSF